MSTGKLSRWGWGAAGAVLLAGSAVAASLPPLPQTKQEALEMEKQRREEIWSSKKFREDELDHKMRLISMALDAGDRAYARELLEDVAGQLGGLMAEKDFQRKGKAAAGAFGRESEKYFMGEPYEQLLAFLYLGILDFQEGAYEMARSSFRSAEVADEMSNIEGYKSDCYVAFLLEALASKAAKDRAMMDEALEFGKRAYVFQQMIETLPDAFTETIEQVAPKNPGPNARKRDHKRYAGEREQFDAAVQLGCSHLAVGFAGTMDAGEGIRKTFDIVLAKLDAPEKKSDEEEYLKLFSKDEKAAGRPQGLLIQLRDAFAQRAGQASARKSRMAQEDFEEFAGLCRRPEVNTYVVLGLGAGPSKRRGGSFASQQIFYEYPEQPLERLLLIEKKGGDNVLIEDVGGVNGMSESVSYQAVTRGGRAMDTVLRKQAGARRGIYTAASIVEQLPYGDLVAGVLRIFASAIHAEADVRAWHELPGEVQLMCAALESGDYTFHVLAFDPVGRPDPFESYAQDFTVVEGKPNMVLSLKPWH